MDPVLKALADRQPPPGRIALVAAHPDDETIGASLLLASAPDLLLVHVTDGAPPADAARLGFPDKDAYADARRAELRAALAQAGSRAQLATLHVPDQGTAGAMRILAAVLGALLRDHDTDVVVTHPFEGGHPDHDATAYAVAHGWPGRTLEMTSYHANGDGSLCAHCFLPAPAGQHPGEVHLDLTPSEADRKRRMLACFRTQSEVLAGFSPRHEAYRAAPRYDWSRPPAPVIYYDQFPWGLSSARWKELACP